MPGGLGGSAVMISLSLYTSGVTVPCVTASVSFCTVDTAVRPRVAIRFACDLPGPARGVCLALVSRGVGGVWT